MQNIVHLRISFLRKGESRKQTRHGYGFVIGEDNTTEELYIVTADHVVSSNKPDDREIEVRAEFCSKRGEYFKTTLLELAYSDIDLALLKVPKPFEGYTWEKQYYHLHPQKDEPVWLLGKPSENDWWYIPTHVEYGAISKLKSWEQRLEAKMRFLSYGNSGGPLLSTSGIVGMVVENENLSHDIAALKIEIIKELVVTEWGRSWGLEPSPSNSIQTIPYQNFNEDLDGLRQHIETLEGQWQLMQNVYQAVEASLSSPDDSFIAPPQDNPQVEALLEEALHIRKGTQENTTQLQEEISTMDREIERLSALYDTARRLKSEFSQQHQQIQAELLELKQAVQTIQNVLATQKTVFEREKMQSSTYLNTLDAKIKQLEKARLDLEAQTEELAEISQRLEI